MAFGDLEFEFGQSIIKKESYPSLEALTKLMVAKKELKLSVEGHTDNTGDDSYNMLLSKNRVEAVKNYLVLNGVDPGRITTAYYGETRPIADNATLEGRKKNRRVEMKFE